MDYRKVLATLTVVGLVFAAAWFVPLPFMHIEAPFLLEPDDVQPVYAMTAGRIVRVHVRPGERVTTGQLLVVLENFELEDEYQRLEADRDIQKTRLTVAQSLSDPTQEILAAQRLASLESRLRTLKDQLSHLRLVAPKDGYVVAPTRVPEPKHDPVRRQLPTWFGTPLDPENVGASLDTGTHLLSIAPDLKDQVAVLYIDQSDRNDVAEGEVVELKFEHLPARTYECQVRTISGREVQFAPEALSNKAGGSLPTATDDEGRERLQSPAYQAVVPLEGDEQLADDVSLLKPGIRGYARFSVSHRTAVEWLDRWWGETFEFRL